MGSVEIRKGGLNGVPSALGKLGNEFIARPDAPFCRHARPSREELTAIVEDLRAVLFPGFAGEGAELRHRKLDDYVEDVLTGVGPRLKEQVLRDLCFTCTEPRRDCMVEADHITSEFIERLPGVQKRLMGDVNATYVGDPASHSHAEVILTYPGILALAYYRLAHELHTLGAPLLARMITEEAHSRTGIDIHPRATIGENLCIDHGTGIVIGATSIIGKDVRIYQGVTLGAKSFPLDENGNPIKGIDRHPIIEDDVTIYAGATILGRVTIGRGSVIGGNVWLTRSLPPGSRVSQASVRADVFGDGGGI